MEKVKLEILGLSPSQSQTGSFALVLGEEFGGRRLPIVIGMFEAQAIAIEIEHIVPNRPMTHDLIKSFAHTFHFTVTEIVISELNEGIFFAKIFCTDGLKETQVDARPSDAIAIALRFNAPIYTTELILNEIGITTTEIARTEGDEDELIEEKPRPRNQSFKDYLKDLTIDELQKILDEALSHEEYERAAKIRDEISRRN